MPVNITTAVDSLVELINNKKRISIEETAKELGLPETIINEWATFLEEEKVIKIEYQFTNAFLVAKQAQESSGKEYSRDIEIISRNLNIMLAGLNKVQINSEIKLKNVEDVKELLKNKHSIDKDVLYAQRFVLEYEINQLLNKIKKLKSYLQDNYDIISQEFNNIKKRKEIFDKNCNKIV